MFSIRGREEFLSLLKSPPSSLEGGIDRQQSHPWTFVEEDVDEVSHHSYL